MEPKYAEAVFAEEKSIPPSGYVEGQSCPEFPLQFQMDVK